MEPSQTSRQGDSTRVHFLSGYPDWDARGRPPNDVTARGLLQWSLCSSAMTEPIPADLTAERLIALITSWELVLRAERKSPQTIKVYRDGLHRYLTWCSLHGAEPMNRTSLNRFVVGLLDAGRAAGTARVRQLAVRRFTAWLIVEGRLPADPFQGMTAPKVDQPVVDPLTDDELRALIRACAAPGRLNGSGPNEPLHHRRDEAIIRLMLETGVRVGEVVALETRDLDLTNALVTVRRGKGGKAESFPSGRPPRWP